MKKRIAVITDDFYLYRKIALTLDELAEVEMLKDESKEVFDTVIADIDYKNIPCDITLSRTMPCSLAVPFTYDALTELVFPKDTAAMLSLCNDGKHVMLRGKRIKLTEVEYSLLSYLICKGGYVQKGELLLGVWDGISNEGIINVYIHYLREKLERGGEKIIICTRGLGYKIDEKYLKGKQNADTY